MGGTHVDGGVGSWSQEACASCKGYPDQGDCSCPPDVLARREARQATPLRWWERIEIAKAAREQGRKMRAAIKDTRR